ncbi:hypothetical protein C8Q74DRAFT_1222756 [Fomes fomentarius]|nr:hypothetical protein C8Q74DRAFT_1222756 [Fomes fomentarius]
MSAHEIRLTKEEKHHLESLLPTWGHKSCAEKMDIKNNIITKFLWDRGQDANDGYACGFMRQKINTWFTNNMESSEPHLPNSIKTSWSAQAVFNEVEANHIQTRIDELMQESANARHLTCVNSARKELFEALSDEDKQEYEELADRWTEEGPDCHLVACIAEERSPGWVQNWTMTMWDQSWSFGLYAWVFLDTDNHITHALLLIQYAVAVLAPEDDNFVDPPPATKTFLPTFAEDGFPLLPTEIDGKTIVKVSNHQNYLYRYLKESYGKAVDAFGSGGADGPSSSGVGPAQRVRHRFQFLCMYSIPEDKYVSAHYGHPMTPNELKEAGHKKKKHLHTRVAPTACSTEAGTSEGFAAETGWAGNKGKGKAKRAGPAKWAAGWGGSDDSSSDNGDQFIGENNSSGEDLSRLSDALPDVGLSQCKVAKAPARRVSGDTGAQQSPNEVGGVLEAANADLGAAAVVCCPPAETDAAEAKGQALVWVTTAQPHGPFVFLWALSEEPNFQELVASWCHLMGQSGIGMAGEFHRGRYAAAAGRFYLWASTAQFLDIPSILLPTCLRAHQPAAPTPAHGFTKQPIGSGSELTQDDVSNDEVLKDLMTEEPSKSGKKVRDFEGWEGGAGAKSGMRGRGATRGHVMTADATTAATRPTEPMTGGR